MKKTVNIHERFQSEAEINDYFSDKGVHCVKCHEDLDGNEPFDHEVSNANRISLTTIEGEQIQSVPRLVCKCGYKNTVLKLLYQTA